METKSSRGRVKGRALAKETDPDAMWDAQFLRTVYGGEDLADLTKFVEKCLALEEQEKELERFIETIEPQRHHKAIRGWLERFYGKRLRSVIGWWPSLVVKAARNDIDRDREVYRYYADHVRIEKIENQLCCDLGRRLVWAIRKRDYSAVYKIVDLAESLRERGDRPLDRKRAWFLMLAGRGPDGKVNRTPRFTCNQFAGIIECDKREVKRFCAEFGIVPRKGFPGRPCRQK